MRERGRETRLRNERERGTGGYGIGGSGYEDTKWKGKVDRRR